MRLSFTEMGDETVPMGYGAAPMSKPGVPLTQFSVPHPHPAPAMMLQEEGWGVGGRELHSKGGAGWNDDEFAFLWSARCWGPNPPSLDVNLNGKQRGPWGCSYLLRSLIQEGNTGSSVWQVSPPYHPGHRGFVLLCGERVGQALRWGNKI